jgi:UDP-N-acetylmuramoyl-tripeptide--D-alanyl-D-alanine ligase
MEKLNNEAFIWVMDNSDIKTFLKSARTVVQMDQFDEDLPFEGISIDSRTIKEKEWFVAICGEKFDGHQFVRDAVQKGAYQVFMSSKCKEQYTDISIPTTWVTDTTDFLMEFAGWFRSNFDIPVVGITGSNGKTTTKDFLSIILNTQYVVTKTERNMNNFIGVSLTLFNLHKSSDIAVVELGTNHPGEIARLTEIVNPTHAAITNIGSGHIGYFGSQQSIYNEKISMFDGLNSQAVIYLNMDDPFLRSYNREDILIRRFGLKEGQDFRARHIAMDKWGRVKFQFNNGPKIQLRLPGEHQLMNALLAASIATDLGISLNNIKKGLESFVDSDKRMQLFEYKGVTFINDAYNSNPQSLKAAIDYLNNLPGEAHSRKYLIIGDMLELGSESETEHGKIADYIRDMSFDFIYCLGEYTTMICQSIQKSQNSNKCSHFKEHKSIASHLQKRLQKGDIVLLKGSRGMEMEKVLEHLNIRR